MHSMPVGTAREDPSQHPAMLDLSVVVVSYRTPDATLACLRSLAGGAGGLRYEVVLVDNAPEDGTAALVRAEFDEVTIVPAPTNVGFARGCNLGAERASGEYLLLLNPDTVVAPGSLTALLEFARRNPSGGLYGGRTLTPEGDLDPKSCWGAPSLWSTACFALGLSTLRPGSRRLNPEGLGPWRRDTVREVDVLSGCLLLVRRDLWRALGGFDPTFFMYSEDVDLSLRAAALGYRPLICPAAVVTHSLGASSPTRADKMVLVAKGKATLMRKHWSPGRAAAGRALLLTGTGLRALGGGVLRRGEAWREVWRRRDEWLAGYPR